MVSELIENTRGIEFFAENEILYQLDDNEIWWYDIFFNSDYENEQLFN